MNYHYHQHHNFCLRAIENIGRASANLNYWPRKKYLCLCLAPFHNPPSLSPCFFSMILSLFHCLPDVPSSCLVVSLSWPVLCLIYDGQQQMHESLIICK